MNVLPKLSGKDMSPPELCTALNRIQQSCHHVLPPVHLYFPSSPFQTNITLTQVQSLDNISSYNIKFTADSNITLNTDKED